MNSKNDDAQIDVNNITFKISAVGTLFLALITGLGSMYGYGQMVSSDAKHYTDYKTDVLREYVDLKHDPLQKDVEEIKKKIKEFDIR